MIEFSGIAIFYLCCLGIGFILALIGAIFGEIAGHGVDFGHGDIAVGGHEIGVGHAPEVSHAGEFTGHEVGIGPDGGDMPGASFFNTITIATLIAFFGLTGLLATWLLRLPVLFSIAFSLPVSILIAVGQFLLYVKLFIKAQASSEATLSDILGCEAEVATSIPAGGVGEIAYVIKGSRYTAPASSSDGQPITRGTRVHVVNIRTNTLIVRPF